MSGRTLPCRRCVLDDDVLRDREAAVNPVGVRGDAAARRRVVDGRGAQVDGDITGAAIDDLIDAAGIGPGAAAAWLQIF